MMMVQGFMSSFGNKITSKIKQGILQGLHTQQLLYNHLNPLVS